MATAPDSKPKRHLLLLPQELLDIILDLAYPAEDETRFIGRALFEYDERERRRWNPNKFAPKKFIHKVDQWMVSKAFFESATRSWVANQHFRDHTFESFSVFFLDVFGRVHLSISTRKPGSILVRYCTKLSVAYVKGRGDFHGLPSLKYLTLRVDQDTFQSSEPAFAWKVSLSQEQLETVAQQSGLADLPKVKQIKLVADRIRYAGTERQREQWSDNVAALETLLQEDKESKMVQEAGTKMLDRPDQNVSSRATPPVEPMFPPQTTSLAVPLADEGLRARMSTSQTGGANKLAQVVSQQNEEVSQAAANTGVDRVGRAEEVAMAGLAGENGKVERAAGTVSVDTPTAEVSPKKRDAREFALPFPKRRALVKYDLPANAKRARRLNGKPWTPVLRTKRPVLPSPRMIPGDEKSAQPGDIKPPNRETDDESNKPSNVVPIGTQTGKERTMTDQSTRQIFAMGDDVVTRKDMFDTTIRSPEEAAKTGESAVFSQGTRSNAEYDQVELEPAVSSQDTQSDPELDQAGKMTTKLTEAKVCTQSTQTEAEAKLTEAKFCTQSTQTETEAEAEDTGKHVCSQGTQTESEHDEGEILAMLKKLEQAVDGLVALHTKPKPAAKASALLIMCSVVCFLLCLWVLMKMVLSNEYVVFYLQQFQAPLLG
ncbi:hypothetical protein AC578_9135 [Pseudocercospora eumusae]|uniref:Uncharacterized protein n=1 Tax=Pseudocercospora eumusae TaxID=321146 RepID=A0A139HV18_9PEZI|nr:hypothetical protein AC578_9135 [Pseudocercospora eumusae]